MIPKPDDEPFATLRAGDLAALKRLLSARPDLIQRKDSMGFSPLMLAMTLHRQDMADAITQVSLSLDLFEAAALGQGWRVESLLKQDPGLVLARNQDGLTALHLAAQFGRADTVALLLRHAAPVNVEALDEGRATPLISAIRAGQRGCAEAILAAGADANARQQGGFSALHWAAHQGDLELITLLLARGAEIHSGSDDGRTPCDMALQAGHPEAAALLRL